MKKHLLISALIFISSSAAFSQNFLWAKNMGGPGYDVANCIRLDGTGNVYVTGYFSDTTDFDPGIGTATLVSAGLEDIFVAKYDNTGNYIWAVSVGGIGNDYGYSIHPDVSGNVFVCGSFENTVDFDPGAGATNLASNGGADIFISKFDNLGNYVWTKTIGGSTNDLSQAVQVDASGNVFFTGYFSGTVDFDASPTNTVNFTSPGVFLDIFVAKYDNAGNYLFAKTMGGSGNDIGNCLQLDGAGNIYIGGSFQATADLDPDAGSSNLVCSGGTDIFLAKYDNTGAIVWAKRFGGGSDDNCYSFQLDGTSNVYFTGYFSSTADFDPGPATANLVSNGNYDIFIAKCDNAGNYVWAKGIGGVGNDLARALQIDASGNPYITGTFEATADFDPGPGTSTMTPHGQADFFITKFDNAGNATRVNRIGNISSTIHPYGFQVDASDNIYMAGQFKGYVDMDPHTFNAAYLSAITNNNIFMVKYDNVQVFVNELKIKNEELKIYPNPNNGQFYLSGNSDLNKLNIEVVDVTGKIIFTTEFNSENGLINLGDHTKGLYLVKISEEKNLVLSKKMSVQ